MPADSLVVLSESADSLVVLSESADSLVVLSESADSLVVLSSGGFRGGSGGSNEPPLQPKLFHFHGEFQEKLV